MNTEAPKTRTNYDDDFKAKAVKRVEDGEAIKVVARDLGIHHNVLRNWTKKADVTPAVAGTAPTVARSSGASARNDLLETLLSLNNIKVPDTASVEKGAKAMMALDNDMDIATARKFTAAVLSSVD